MFFPARRGKEHSREKDFKEIKDESQCEKVMHLIPKYIDMRQNDAILAMTPLPLLLLTRQCLPTRSLQG